MPKPHGAETREAATKGASIPSIISAADIDCNLYHQKLCEQLLPHTTGWENFFIREISKLKSLSELQREKLASIAKKCAENEASGRLCRYCGRLAHKITEFSYYCRQCGDCLSLDWHGGGK